MKHKRKRYNKRSTRRRSTRRRSTRRRSTRRRSTRRRSTRRRSTRRRSTRRRSTRRRSTRKRVKGGDSPLDMNERDGYKDDTKKEDDAKKGTKTKSVVDPTSSTQPVDKLTLIYIYHEVGKYPNQIPETIRVDEEFNLTRNGNTLNITGKSLSLALDKPRIHWISDNVYTLTSGMTRINFRIDKNDKKYPHVFNYPDKGEEEPYFKNIKPS
jgi:hypothetical protein